MKFKEYLDNLNKIAKDNPESLEFTVISSSDDEGNSFREVWYEPTLGEFEETEFHSQENYEEEPEEYEDFKINAICIN